ncbi:MAG: deoxyribodipyrimidine photo-lyase [Verrucomicrobia bacterium]|nr:deoxyribodipyrimidine photo-lyase [Verrucomicrobiota bacterium]
MKFISIVWFRHDLRLEDHPALHAAVARGAVLPVFIWAPEEEAPWPPGSASRWWLHQSLLALETDLKRAGSRLIIRRGPTRQALLGLAKDGRASAVFWNRRYEPAVMARDVKVMESLRSAGLEAESFNGALLHEPWEVQTKSGGPFQVFTPFWKTCLALPAPPKPWPAPRELPAPRKWPVGLPVEALELEPEVNWAGGLRASWKPGRAGARAELKRFLNERLLKYDGVRDFPSRVGTSRLSPHLHFGEISPRQVWHAVRRSATEKAIPEERWPQCRFLAEIGWREFAHHLLHHFPHTPAQPLRSQFAKFPWRDEPVWLRAWQRGLTGFPFVDAGMRELWATGWMHNRVRMVVASFLVKHLLISWLDGARWFWDTLVDADLANNTLGWQWTAGCGADAAPYFRIFNPVSQGKKFDPKAKYIRRWVPELAKLPDRWIHAPWEAPAESLARAGVTLGENYPKPIVKHLIARETALEAYRKVKGQPHPDPWTSSSPALRA